MSNEIAIGTVLPNQIPPAPVDMVMSPYYDHILSLNWVVLGLVALWILRDARATRSLLPILILVGAAISCLQECIFDVMVLVWWPQYGPEPLYRFLNVSVPVWMLAAYPWYIGGQGYWMYKKLQQGMTAAQLWKLYCFAWVANLFLEIPPLQIGNIYTYYGDQPLQVLGFPLWMAMTNSLMPILMAAMLWSLRDVLTGVRVLFVVPLVPMAVGAAQIVAGWPIWLALNSGLGYAATYPAAFLTLGLSLSIVYLVSLKFCRKAEPVVATRAAGLQGAVAR